MPRNSGAFPLGALKLQIVPLSQVEIASNRQRQEFDPDALQELKNSIEDRGLMHPIVVRHEGSRMILVAGERRLRAIDDMAELGSQFNFDGKEVPLGSIPVVTLGELTTLEAEEAELDENLKRRDLTWQETADAHARLHKLRVAQQQARSKEFPVEQGYVATPSQTIADTAKEIHGRSDGAYQDNVRKEIIVARHLDNPVIAKAKNLDEAFKLLKKQEEADKNRKLAATVGETFTSDIHQLVNKDCLTHMRQFMSAESVDVILTDPPYGMDADQFGDGGGKMTGIEHHYKDDYHTWKHLLSQFAKEIYRIAKPQAHAYLFCDFDRFHELKDFMQTAGWYVHRTPFVVHKLDSGRVPLPDRGPRRQWELVLYAIKGNKTTTHIYPDVIPCTADKNMSHGAQKPVALFQNLLQRSVKAGDVVFDGFAGSGTIFEAAHTYKCQAIACELNPEYYGMAMKRLQALKDNETLGLFP